MPAAPRAKATAAASIASATARSSASSRFIGRFMIEFGLLSSLFDLLTFAGLLWLFHAGPATFRTAWFVESLLTELAVVLVMRTRRPFFASRPGRVLLMTTAGVAALALALPYLPRVEHLGFVPLPLPIVSGLALVTCAYVLATELLKRRRARSAEVGRPTDFPAGRMRAPSDTKRKAFARLHRRAGHGVVA